MSVQQQDQPFRLGNIAPDFEADTTQGRISFYEHIEDNWAILFCYPDDFTPVATTELVLFAQLQTQFAKRGVKLLGLATNNQPTATGDYVPHEEWVKDVDSISLTPIKFPIISDTDGTVSRLYHVLHDEDVESLNADDSHTSTLAFKSRTIFIIGPHKHFRLVFNYPASVGVNPAEVLRAVDCLQTAAHAGVHTPANWVPGRDVIIPLKMSDAEAEKKFPGYTTLRPYLRFAALPMEDTSIEQIEEISDKAAANFMEASA